MSYFDGSRKLVLWVMANGKPGQCNSRKKVVRKATGAALRRIQVGGWGKENGFMPPTKRVNTVEKLRKILRVPDAKHARQDKC